MGSIRRPWTASAERGNYRPCSLDILFSSGDSGGISRRRRVARSGLTGSRDLGGERGNRGQKVGTHQDSDRLTKTMPSVARQAGGYRALPVDQLVTFLT